MSGKPCQGSLESYQSALKNGDLEVVGYCDKHKSQYSYFVGQELTDL